MLAPLLNYWGGGDYPPPPPPRLPTPVVSNNSSRAKLVNKEKRLLLAVPRRLFCFGSLVILDVARCYLWLFTLYINIKISKNGC